MSFKLKVSLNTNAISPENLSKEEKAIELAEKIFDVVMKTDHAGFGARAVDIALRGLFQFEQFPEAFSASSDLTNHMLSRGHIKLEVVEL